MTDDFDDALALANGLAITRDSRDSGEAARLRAAADPYPDPALFLDLDDGPRPEPARPTRSAGADAGGAPGPARSCDEDWYDVWLDADRPAAPSAGPGTEPSLTDEAPGPTTDPAGLAPDADAPDADAPDVPDLAPAAEDADAESGPAGEATPGPADDAAPEVPELSAPPAAPGDAPGGAAAPQPRRSGRAARRAARSRAAAAPAAPADAPDAAPAPDSEPDPERESVPESGAVPAPEPAPAPASAPAPEGSAAPEPVAAPAPETPPAEVDELALPPVLAEWNTSGRRAPDWQTARETAFRAVRPLPAALRSLEGALGHTLAEPLPALTDLPAFDTAAMDGWAVSGPGPWHLVTPMAEPRDEQPPAAESDDTTADPAADPAAAPAAEPADDTPAVPPPPAHPPRPQTPPAVLAGSAEPEPLADGLAVAIATGARVPAATSAVLRSERGRVSAGQLRGRNPEPGADIRPRGQECRSGTELLPAGTAVTPAVLGLAAAAGYDQLTVHPRPRVEVLVLGDELLHRGLPSGGRIRDALGPMTAPWLTMLGAEVLVTRRLGDDAEALYEAVSTSRAHLVVTTGSTAAGPADRLRPVLDRLGARLRVDGVAVRPGHPMLLAELPDGRPLVGLPGNPLAAVTGMLTLAAPLLASLAGRELLPLPAVELTEEVTGHATDTRVVPVRYPAAEPTQSPRFTPGFTGRRDGRTPRARPVRFSGPAMLRGLAGADALALVPPGGAPLGQRVPLVELPRG